MKKRLIPNWNNLFVVPPRLELGQAEPESDVLPLHQGTIPAFGKAMQNYKYFLFLEKLCQIIWLESLNLCLSLAASTLRSIK